MTQQTMEIMMLGLLVVQLCALGSVLFTITEAVPIYHFQCCHSAVLEHKLKMNLKIAKWTTHS